MNENTEKVKEIAERSQYLSDFPHHKKSVEYGAFEMAKWKDEKYKGLIKMLVDELNTSKLYHLGITGLDTDEEIAQKRKDGDTALIRGIERTIKFVEESIE